MKIRTKLSLAMSILMFFFVLVTILFSLLSNKVKYKLVQFDESSLPESVHSAAMIKALYQSQASGQELIEEQLRVFIDPNNKKDVLEERDIAIRNIRQALSELEGSFQKCKAATERSMELAAQLGEYRKVREEQSELDGWLSEVDRYISEYEKRMNKLIEISDFTGEGTNLRTESPAADYLEEDIEPLFRDMLLPAIETYRRDTSYEFVEEIRSIREKIDFARKIMFAALTTAMITAFLLSVFLARQISRPLIELSRVALGITEGRFDSLSVVRSNDEIGRLARALDTMMRKLCEQTLTLNTTNKQLSEEVRYRKEAEGRTKASLAEKEMLLKEIHHRVKNNLQIITSLLYLQTERIENADAVAALLESRSRVKTMAIIHEKLYRSDDLARVNFEDYLEDLTAYLNSSYLLDKRDIHIVTDVEKLILGIDKALPCGLIINELVTNAIRHAFDHDRKGTITVALHLTSNRHYHLSVTDDGKGMPPDIDFDSPNTLGLQLVVQLTEQLNGRLTAENKGGTEITVHFEAV